MFVYLSFDYDPIVAIGVESGDSIGVAVGVTVGVSVGVAVGVGVNVGVTVGVGVGVRLGVTVGVAVEVGVGGVATKVRLHAKRATPSYSAYRILNVCAPAVNARVAE